MKKFTFTWKTTMNTAACGTALQKNSAMLNCTVLIVFLVQLVCDLFSK